MPRSGATTLSGVEVSHLTVIREPCKRRGRYAVATLTAKHGHARLTDLRSFLSADCPKRAKCSIGARCDVKFDPPPETRRERPAW